MRVVGVIDLMAGRAVHARLGRREDYRPVRTAAGASIQGDPIALARAYLDHLGLTELYVADLDAILGRQPQDALLEDLARLAPLWVDAGTSSPGDARRMYGLGAAHVVIGLETLGALDTLPGICAAIGAGRAAFSLDLRLGEPGTTRRDLTNAPAHVIAARAADAGAGAIIVLDLGRVGAESGPDVDLVARVREAASGPTLLVGGGVRDAGDVARLAEVGCDGVLIATALHTGRMSAAAVAGARRLEPHRSARR